MVLGEERLHIDSSPEIACGSILEENAGVSRALLRGAGLSCRL